ncbi:DUF5008 domain-containing protein [Sphingobacterium composti Ten et al. 2007 non Yoo et al. 2007]|uniref:DUF5008 domain-containing protein n=1 Tax=Sphingobacterium composti TaxID=363260 RepID=UPI001357D25B|nr:DUF5008 domain-containing protein [Sphingobacterium composti Ten et al. 2007 non Yoo et al. 2007]
MKITINQNNKLWILLVILLTSSCKDLPIGENPYDGGQPPLGIKFEFLNRKLDAVRPNDNVTVNIRGIGSQTLASLTAFINEQKAEVIAVSDSTMTLKVPEKVSSGIVKLLVDNQVFYGPRVPIEGKTKVDAFFSTGRGFNGTVYSLMLHNSNYYVGGSFRNYKNEAEVNKTFRNGLHIINQNGDSQGNSFGRGVEFGLVRGIKQLSDGRFIVNGDFSEFNKKEAAGVTILNSNGEVNTMVVDVVNSDPSKPADGKDTVSIFNGQFLGTVANVYPVKDKEQIIAVGNFNFHSQIDYRFSTKNIRAYNYTRVGNVARVSLNGKLDSAFQFNNVGLNGAMVGSAQLSNGKIIIVGGFTSYNNQAARNIVVINENGTIDQTFAGSGANNWIESIHYNPTTKKIGLAGRFTEYNGQKVNGAVILNEDGSIDNTFKLGDTEGKFPNFIYLLNNGKVFVAGSFNKYMGINRNPFLILEKDGEAIQDYNNLGGFSGFVYSAIETTSSERFPALLIGGLFTTIEGINAGCIMRLEIKN